MSIDVDRLRGAIYRAYKSQNSFTVALNWPKNKIGGILKGARIPDIHECSEMCEKLGLTRNEFLEIFLPELSPNGDRKAS